MMKMRVARVPGRPEVPPPQYQTEGASGLDLCAAIEEPLSLNPGQSALVPTGFAFEIPAGFEGQIRARSGLSSRLGLTVLNGPGTIDSDFRGEVKAIMINLGSEKLVIEPGMRIAQMVICPVEHVRIAVVGSLITSERGNGGFGSTGV